MEKTNAQLFADLPENRYFRSVEAAATHFKDIQKFPGSLGFDTGSGGFLAIHRGHAATAISQEIPACLILKKLGFGVILEDEPQTGGVVDCTINGRKFEIKQVARAKNFKNAVFWQIRFAVKKCRRVLLHIDQKANEQQVRGALYHAIKRYPIDIVWVIFEGKLFCFEKGEILKGHHRFSPKK